MTIHDTWWFIHQRWEQRGDMLMDGKLRDHTTPIHQRRTAEGGAHQCLRTCDFWLDMAMSIWISNSTLNPPPLTYRLLHYRHFHPLCLHYGGTELLDYILLFKKKNMDLFWVLNKEGLILSKPEVNHLFFQTANWECDPCYGRPGVECWLISIKIRLLLREFSLGLRL